MITFWQQPRAFYPSASILLILAISFPCEILAGAWQELNPICKQRKLEISDFMVDKDGTPWAIAAFKLYRSNGREWVHVPEADPESLQARGLMRFYGGPGPGVYVSQSGPQEHKGLLFRLENGQAQKLVDYYYDSPHEQAGLFVSRNDQVFNFSQHFIAVLRDGKWDTTETLMSRGYDDILILDFSPAGNVVFVRRKDGLACIWNGQTFQTNVRLAHLLPPLDEEFSPLRGCRWGNNRALFVASRPPQLRGVQFGEQPAAVDVSGILEAIGSEAYMYDLWSGPDGSAWLLVSRRRASGYTFHHLSPEGTVTEQGQTCRFAWDSDRCSRYPRSIMQTRDGAVWFSLPRWGIRRLQNGEVQVFGWREGVTAISINWLFEAPNDQMYAASSRGKVYEWAPEAAPDTSLTERWEEFLHVASYNCRPLMDLQGRLWMFRADVLNSISRWDGNSWLHIPMPFPTGKARQMVVDDRGHVIVETDIDSQKAYDVSPDSVTKFEGLREALAAAVEDGATRFVAPHLAGPVVVKGGQIWFARRGYDFVDVYMHNQWSSLTHKEVREIVIGDNNEPLLATRDTLWTYRKGRLVKLVQQEAGQPELRVLMPSEQASIPLLPGLPEGFCTGRLIVASRKGNRWIPLNPEEVDRIAKAEPWDWPAERERMSINPDAYAIPGGAGGFWIHQYGQIQYRWFGNTAFRLDARGTPFCGQSWRIIGIDARGGLWIDAGRDGAGVHCFVRKGPPPAVRIRGCEVTRGRRLNIVWETEDDVIAAFWRLAPDEDWRPCPPGSDITWAEKQPGKRTITVALRAMDSLGMLGPEATQTAELDVRLPDTQWTSGSAPKRVDDMVWPVPVAGLWTAQDVPGRIEYRIGDGEWEPLPEFGRLPVVNRNHQAVNFQFRAVEEDEFAALEPLSATVAIEFSLEEAIAQRIRRLVSCEQESYDQAIEDLKTAPGPAMRLLREKIKSIDDQLANARAAGLESSIQELAPIRERLGQALAALANIAQ